jgi:putative ABC transport system permease protein
MIAWETLVVGLLASAAGVVPGTLLASTLGGTLAARGIAPEDLHVAPGPVPVIATVAITALTAMVAVVAAGRRAARVQPTQALQESAAEPPRIGGLRLGLGVLALGVGSVLLTTSATSGNPTAAADTATVSAFVLILATALLGPIVVRLTASVAARALSRGRHDQAFLAASNLRSASRRFASATTPLVLCVAMSCLLLFLTTTRQHATAEQGEDRLTADLVVQSDGAGIPPAAVAEMRAVEGVKTAVGIASTTLGPTLGARYGELPAAIADPRGIGDVLDLDVRGGSLGELRDGTIALSATQAAAAHARIGSRVPVTLGDGTRQKAEVVAVYERSLGFGEVLLPSSMAAGHRTSPLHHAVLIGTAPGTSRAEVAAQLRSLSGRYPGLTVGDRRDVAVRAEAERETVAWLFRLLVLVVFVFTAIAVVNTLMMIGLHRTRELSMLRLVGATSRQVRAMARRESGMVVALGLALGGTIALLALMPTSTVLSGSAIPYAPAGLVLLVLGSAAAVGLAGSEIATRLALRARPVDAIGLRD